MFTRRVSMQLKSNGIAEFTQRIEKDILPLLRKQKGFGSVDILNNSRKGGDASGDTD